MANSWAEKGESHRALTFEMAHSALQKAPEMLQHWKVGKTSTERTRSLAEQPDWRAMARPEWSM
jgi:hypothetical protein